ncbi:hypothetical protein WME73_16315 [Sorangium sp. So ce302]|uniref:protein kinase domain-containing protein n=1 Tax=Sorangium sp. So ce302 TaxID=3133297 RepID=UPI003F5F5322
MSEPSTVTPRLAERFRLLDVAGSGGSAEVWRAVDQERGGVVALKIEPRERGASAAQRASVRRVLGREALHAALALSPRLPELVDVGWLAAPSGVARVARVEGAPGEEGRAFVAMRWIEGRAVADALRGLPPGERAALALAAARDAGEALADLHGIGLAHGDLKPENLILTPEGRIAVIDLGLACSIHETSVDGATLRYIARGDAELGDARARDLLALGTLLAEIAFPGVADADDPIGAARAAAAAESAAGPTLDAIWRALLSPSPAARPSSAWVTESARAAIAGAQRARPPFASPPGRAGRDAGAPGAERDREDRDARRVRAAYLRLRRHELEAALGVRDDVAPWLVDAFAVVERVRALSGASLRAGDGAARVGPPQSDAAWLGRLGPDRVARWLTALAGTSAAAWPMGRSRLRRRGRSRTRSSRSRGRSRRAPGRSRTSRRPCWEPRGAARGGGRAWRRRTAERPRAPPKRTPSTRRRRRRWRSRSRVCRRIRSRSRRSSSATTRRPAWSSRRPTRSGCTATPGARGA